MACGNLHARHWFTVYGSPGIRAPFCVRCGAPNPRPLDQNEQDNYDYFMRQRDGILRQAGIL